MWPISNLTLWEQLVWCRNHKCQFSGHLNFFLRISAKLHFVLARWSAWSMVSWNVDSYIGLVYIEEIPVFRSLLVRVHLARSSFSLWSMWSYPFSVWISICSEWPFSWCLLAVLQIFLGFEFSGIVIDRPWICPTLQRWFACTNSKYWMIKMVVPATFVFVTFAWLQVLLSFLSSAHPDRWVRLFSDDERSIFLVIGSFKFFFSFSIRRSPFFFPFFRAMSTALIWLRSGHRTRGAFVSNSWFCCFYSSSTLFNFQVLNPVNVIVKFWWCDDALQFGICILELLELTLVLGLVSAELFKLILPYQVGSAWPMVSWNVDSYIGDETCSWSHAALILQRVV